MENKEKPNVLIVYGYHAEEVFAAETGRYLLKDALSAEIKVVEHSGRINRGTSTYYLRKFVGMFDPLISPVVLHGDDDMGADMAIIYNAKSKREKRAAHRPLLEFCFEHSNHGDGLIVWGKFLTQNTDYGTIDIELNSRMGVAKAAAMVKEFSQYLIDLYLRRGLKL